MTIVFNGAKIRILDSAGNPVNNAKINTYAAGTTTPLATYTDFAGAVANANPVRTAADGTALIRLPPGVGYRFVITDANDVSLPDGDVDHIYGALSDSVPGNLLKGGFGSTTDSTTANNDVASWRFIRDTSHTGGTAGFVNSCARFETNVNDANITAFEWTVLGICYNYATGGENVAGYFQGNKYNTGPTWGGVAEAIDHTATANPNSGLVGWEVDVRANGTDSNRQRLGIDVVVTRPYTNGSPAGTTMVAAYGVRVQNGGDSGASVETAFSVNSGAVVGYDTANATISQAAYRMASGQAIGFTSTTSRKLLYDGTGLKVADGSNTLLFRANDDGTAQLGVNSVAATSAGAFSAARHIQIKQLDGTSLYIPAMLATW